MRPDLLQSAINEVIARLLFGSWLILCGVVALLAPRLIIAALEKALKEFHRE